jgi:hypothetical protein
VGSTKSRTGKPGQSDKTKPAEKPILLNDLIPTRDVSGGRKAVFGSVPAAPAGNKRKNQK